MKTKKIILTVLSLLLIKVSTSQIMTCECQKIKNKTVTATYCPYSGQDEFGNTINNPNALTITVEYDETNCGGIKVSEIKRVLISTAYLRYQDNGWTIPPCPDLHPLTWDINAWNG